jgi:hypothetical protein
MDAERVETQIAALLDQADVEHARIVKAIADLQATSVTLQNDVTSAAGRAVKDAFEGLQKDIERARGAMKWFSYRWVAIAGLTLVLLSALGFGVLWASLTWQRHELAELTEQRTALEADIAEMQVNAAALAKKGARIKIVDCGGRLCIVASKNQTGSFSDWHGLWNNATTGQTMVIPNGY